MLKIFKFSMFLRNPKTINYGVESPGQLLFAKNNWWHKSLFPLREAIKVEKKNVWQMSHMSHLLLITVSEVFVTLFILCLEWPNSSRNTKKNFFPLWGGGGGWPQPPSEDQFCENFLSILTFSRGKNNFDQSCSLWCQKLKKIGCKLSHFFFIFWRLP